MATSIRKAQTPLSCQLCSIPRVIKWKCTECELLMCDNCKTTVHSRIKTAEKHNIITIQEVGKDLSERLKALHISDLFSTVFQVYTTDVPGIHKLICCADDIIYFMSNGNGHHFIKAELLRGSIKVLKKFDIACVDFAISSKDKIVYSPQLTTKLKAMSTTSMKTKTVLNTSTMLISAIHISKHDELLLGFRDQGPKYTVTDSTIRQVAIFGTDFKHKSTIERDETGKKLFTFVRRISTDSANNIYVVDWFDNDNRGRIVSIDRNGRKRFFYNGCAFFNTHEAAFNPNGIVVTSNDTTVVSDSNNHALHALSASGELVGLQIIRNFDILYPCSLSIDFEGFLLIGNNTNNTKIHVVKLSS